MNYMSILKLYSYSNEFPMELEENRQTDKVVLKNCRKKIANFCVFCLDYKKIHSMILYFWPLKYVEAVTVVENTKSRLKELNEAMEL